MAKQAQTKGCCSLCGAEYTRAGMSKHIIACAPEHFAQKFPSKASKKSVFLLVVHGAFNPEYWMYVAVPATATLEDLDGFLRDIWLECCGHLSQFIINKVYYVDERALTDSWIASSHEDRSMRTQLKEVLKKGKEFIHEYDMGTTTRLKLKVLSTFDAQMPQNQVVLLARNHPPEIRCEVCGEPAAFVCTECIWDGLGWLCARCAKQHECGEEMLLPVVNSPRVGMCAYTGDADWEQNEKEEP
ncbi:MAG: hypothetical protein KatS3mg023_0421 [Armatimonadota bacterium]|nr:MAG: hypothetical protein KatS3mg023_0421 [Armatimonadota bacterium]